MKEYTVGVLGGMGSYATAHFFKKMIDAFPVEKEWDRPRVIIDNRCTMPSRVRAILYGEKREELLSQMEESIRILAEDYDADRIVLACNTSHYFYPELEKRIPSLKEKSLHLIKCCADKLTELGIRQVGLIASEGTIESGIFESILDPVGIKVMAPGEDVYPVMRSVIEDVKQNRMNDQTGDNLLKIIEMLGTDSVILGCTELPIAYDRFWKEIDERYKGTIVDPVQCVIERIVKDYDNNVS